MPNRLIKESICRSEDIDSLSWFEEVLFYRLIVNCDDYGRFDGREKIIKSICFPLKDLRDSELTKALSKLAAQGLVIKYEVQGKPFLQLPKWEHHQQIRSKKSKYPGMDAENANVISDDIRCNQMISDDSKCPRNPIQSESESESESNPKGTRAFIPPTVAEVQDYCRERENGIDAQQFVDFYASKGWMVGRNRMRDWKACVRTWEQRRSQETRNSTQRSELDAWASA